MALIMDGGLIPEMNTVQEFMAKAQVYNECEHSSTLYRVQLRLHPAKWDSDLQKSQ